VNAIEEYWILRRCDDEPPAALACPAVTTPCPRPKNQLGPARAANQPAIAHEQTSLRAAIAESFTRMRIWLI
jgi:hypothetical protein